MDNKERMVDIIKKKQDGGWRFVNGDYTTDLSNEELAEHLLSNDVFIMPEGGIGEFSDGYHTFNELYHHRAVLFSVICNMFPDIAWKSKIHDDGTMYDGMFIVGINTPEGQATYHYDLEPYWDMFKVKELEKAPKYDGHTPADAINRIGKLSGVGVRKVISTSHKGK